MTRAHGKHYSEIHGKVKSVVIKETLVEVKRRINIHYYFHEHEGLNGKTPTGACRLTIEGENKWKTLI